MEFLASAWLHMTQYVIIEHGQQVMIRKSGLSLALSSYSLTKKGSKRVLIRP